MRKAILLSTLLLVSCAVGPNYRRPDVQAPANFRGASFDQLSTPSTTSLADTKWFDLFKDDVLKQLITTAIAGNFDLRIAAERIMQSRSELGEQRSFLFPTVDAQAQFAAVRTSKTGSFKLPAGSTLLSDVSYTQFGFSLGWELDVWGRVRRLNEAARAQYLATEEARRGVTTTLIADVTSTYMALRELDLELEISQKTRKVAEDSLRLTQIRHRQGAVTALDESQAEQFLYSATAQVASTEREIGQTENALSVLLGNSPGDIPRGRTLEELQTPLAVPAGLPSPLLERRPDIREAEQTLIAANAQIGAARAQYFPQIDLTAFMGGQSRALTGLFTGPARAWTFASPASLPIFNAGRIRSRVQFAEAVQREMVVSYDKTIQNAFREVSDALIGYEKTREQRSQQERLVQALRETNRLSEMRYRGGIESYLQVLDAERNLFQGELALARLRQQELTAVVQLYRALGGGWE